MKAALSLIIRSQRTRVLLVTLIAYAIPGVSLIVLGVLYLRENDWLIEFAAATTALVALVGLMAHLIQRQHGRQSENLDETPHLAAPRHWPPRDLEVWRLAMNRIADNELDLTAWPDMRKAAVAHLNFIADAYHGDQNDAHVAYGFTVPELLLLIETCSARYRAFILRNLPLVNEVKVSQAITLTNHSRKGYELYSRHRRFIDLGRAVIAPATMVADAVKGLVLGELFDQISGRAERNLKSAFFEHITESAIDLYSGRLHLSEEEVAAYEAQKARSAKAVPVPPLRVLVVGQVKSGKSTLVNRLCQESATDIDSLPATSTFRAYRVTLSNGLEFELVDSPGLDGSPAVEKSLLNEAVNADLVLWVCQANQPAKSLDQALATKWLDYFEAALHRKPPAILLVTTHNDRLLPNVPWSPPYNLADPSDRVGAIMLEAYSYCREAIGLEAHATVIPLASPSQGDSYNFDVLRAAVEAAGEEARAVQHSRHRNEAAKGTAVRALMQTAGALNQGIELLMQRGPKARIPSDET